MEKVDSSLQVDITRYQGLPKGLRILFIAFTAFGIGLAVVYIFNIMPVGLTMYNTAYYYLLFAIFMMCAFLVYPARKKERTIPWYDVLFAVSAFGIALYFFLHTEEIREVGWVPPSLLNLILAVIFILLIVEGSRRIVGLSYVIVIVLLGIYPLVARHMPGMFYGFQFPFPDMIGLYVFGSEGVVGIIAKVVGETLIGYLLFAGVMVYSGASKFFIDISLALLGRYRGGPAKVAVIGSAFFGSLSGSIFANIVGTGSFTIPAMKRLGYPPHYAGAIEACASTGGTIMPPVMGALAFVAAAMIGTNYGAFVVAAVIPSILYYFSLLMAVDAYAAKAGLKGLPREEVPALIPMLKRGWPFLLTIAFLIWALVYMNWERTAPFYASGLLFILSFAQKETMMTPKKIIEAIVSAGKLISEIVLIMLPAGIVMASLVMTGLCGSFTSGLVALGSQDLILILLFGVIACYILGMAGIVLAAYIFLALSLAPAVIQLGGLNVVAVHLFIMYYAVLAGITLPVAPAAFLAATIAGASPIRTAWTAMRLGIMLYFIPFFFVLQPALVLQGSLLTTLYSIFLCFVGIAFIAAGLEGYIFKIGACPWWARPALIIGGILIAFPSWETAVAGVILCAIILSLIVARKRMMEKKSRTGQREIV